MEQRFLSKVNKTDGCWLWTASKDEKRYGHFGIGQRVCKAHRVAYELWNGPIPAGVLVRHKCDEPSCVNPEHLELGTNQDNVDDRQTRGRGRWATGKQHGTYTHPHIVQGQNNGRSKLTDDDVREIRILRGFGFIYKELGKMYNIHPEVSARICRRDVWKHII